MEFSKHAENHYFTDISPLCLCHVTRVLDEKWPHHYNRKTFQEILPDIFNMPVLKQVSGRLVKGELS